jgi:hypothetical protein
MDKYSVTNPYNRILFRNEKDEVLIHATTWMNLGKHVK